MLSPKMGRASSRRKAVASARLSPGLLSTRSTIARQKRPSGFVRSNDLRPTNGSRSASTRSPRSPSSAGSSVSAVSTDITPAKIAPVARLRKMFEGTRKRPNIAITNAEPLKRTARLAVAPAAAIDASGSRPPPRSSR